MTGSHYDDYYDRIQAVKVSHVIPRLMPEYAGLDHRNVTTNGLIINKRYPVVKRCGYKDCLGEIRNENGDVRVVPLDGVGPSAHIMTTPRKGRLYDGWFGLRAAMPSDLMVGYFEIVTEEE